jgi:hypothetical protein
METPYQEGVVVDFNVLKSYVINYITFASGRQYNPLAKEGTSQLNITEDGKLTVWSVKEKTKDKDVFIANDPAEFVKKEAGFREKLSELHYNVKTTTEFSQGINSTKKMKFLSSLGGSVKMTSSPMTYNEYMMNILETNIEPGRPVDASDPNSELVYFANPVLTFDQVKSNEAELEVQNKKKNIPPSVGPTNPKIEKLRDNWSLSIDAIRKSTIGVGFSTSVFDADNKFTVLTDSTEEGLIKQIEDFYMGQIESIKKPKVKASAQPAAPVSDKKADIEKNKKADLEQLKTISPGNYIKIKGDSKDLLKKFREYLTDVLGWDKMPIGFSNGNLTLDYLGGELKIPASVSILAGGTAILDINVEDVIEAKYNAELAALEGKSVSGSNYKDLKVGQVLNITSKADPSVTAIFTVSEIEKPDFIRFDMDISDGTKETGIGYSEKEFNELFEVKKSVKPSEGLAGLAAQAAPDTGELLDLDLDLGDIAEDIGKPDDTGLKSIRTSLKELKKTCD